MTHPRTPRPDRRRDRGATVVELPLAVSLLLIPVAVAVMVLPQWPEAQNVATSAAQEAASSFVNAPDPDTGLARAEAAIARHQTNYRRDLRLDLDGDWCRGCIVVATVTVTVPAVQIPFLGSTGELTYTATSSARIEDYRSL